MNNFKIKKLKDTKHKDTRKHIIIKTKNKIKR